MKYCIILILLCVISCTKKNMKNDAVAVTTAKQSADYYEETWPEEPASARIKELPICVVYFDFNSWRLDYNAMDDIRKNVKQEGRIEIRGHACVIGTDEYNLGLSDQRAQAVQRYIGYGDVVAYGEAKCEALCEDKNELDCKECRKVEIVKIFK